MTLVLHASTRPPDEEAYPGRIRYVRIVVHDTKAELRKAADRSNPYEDWASVAVAACYHPPLTRERFDRKTKTWVDTTHKQWGGVIRFSKEELNGEIITHECVHAALAIYRMDIRPNANFWRQCNASEEWIAYLIGDLTSTVAGKLSLAGVI